MGIGEMGGVLGDEGVVTSDGIAWNGGERGRRNEEEEEEGEEEKKRRKRRRKRRRVIRDSFFI